MSDIALFSLNLKQWKSTISNVINLLHRISEIQLILLGELTVWPANFTVEQYMTLFNQWVSLVESDEFHLFLCGRIITFETVVFHRESVSFYSFGFREFTIRFTQFTKHHVFLFIALHKFINFEVLKLLNIKIFALIK